MVVAAQRTCQLHPRTASKLFGCFAFLGHGCYGKVGRAGLRLLKERQDSQGPSVDDRFMTQLQFVAQLLRMSP